MLQTLVILSQALLQSCALINNILNGSKNIPNPDIIRLVLNDLYKASKSTNKQGQVVKQLAILEPEITDTCMYFLLGFQSLDSRAQEYMTNLFMYWILFNVVPNYPYQEGIIDKWFPQTLGHDQKSKSDGASQNNNIVTVKLINTSCEEKLSAHIENIIKGIQLQEHDQIYYHGTDQDGGQSILEDGVRLEVGWKRCDFSSGNAFYLTDSSDYALWWAKRKCKTRRAILMFHIKGEHLCKYKGLDLNSSREDWKKVTDYFGSQKQGRRPLKALKKCDYIEGPLTRDGTNEHPNAKQLCIKNAMLAKSLTFGEVGSICGGLFFFMDEI